MAKKNKALKRRLPRDAGFEVGDLIRWELPQKPVKTWQQTCEVAVWGEQYAIVIPNDSIAMVVEVDRRYHDPTYELLVGELRCHIDSDLLSGWKVIKGE